MFTTTKTKERNISSVIKLQPKEEILKAWIAKEESTQLLLISMTYTISHVDDQDQIYIKKTLRKFWGGKN